jgi:hypothetical protein
MPQAYVPTSIKLIAYKMMYIFIWSYIPYSTNIGLNPKTETCTHLYFSKIDQSILFTPWVLNWLLKKIIILNLASNIYMLIGVVGSNIFTCLGVFQCKNSPGAFQISLISGFLRAWNIITSFSKHTNVQLYVPPINK